MALAEKHNYNLAIVSPTKDALSETFIKAHVDHLHGNIFHYYNGFLPKAFVGHGSLLPHSFISRIGEKLGRSLRRTRLSVQENAFLKSLRKNKIEVVLAEYGQTGAAIAPICKLLNIPLIVHFHGYDAHNKDVIAKYGKAYHEMFAYARAVIAVSNTMKKSLMDLGCPAEKLVLNPYGPIDDFFQLNPDYQSNNFLAVGRFVDKKAPYAIIMAFKNVLEKFGEARLIMVGKGSLLNSTQNLAKILGIDNAINFKGAQNHEQVKRLMEGSFCFVQHSITADSGDMEGSPVGILEAAAAGLPVISTKHAGIEETVLQNISGYLVSELDVVMMSSYMIELFMDRIIAKKFGDNARKHIKSKFSIQKHLNTLNHVVGATHKSDL
jgi:colanic acid/amylovoran biosynthesis glycosyltransferase